MFRLRLLTTLVLLPLVLALVLLGDTLLLDGVVLFLVLVSGYEWLGLVPVQHRLARMACLVLLVGATYLAFGLFPRSSGAWLVTGFWILVVLALVYYPLSARIWGYRAVVLLAAFFLLPLFGLGLHGLAGIPHGKALLVYVLLLVWAADIGAYLAGKLCGKHKLIPAVSPGKTLEGLLGGMLLALGVAVGGWFVFAPDSVFFWYGLALLTAMFSVVGDLFFSMLKRRCNLKDTGRFFPGHGGMLDRIDSLIAAIPLFYLFYCREMQVAF